jgi:phage tail sheath gpL-like
MATIVSNPEVNIVKQPASTPVENTAQKVLIVGQLVSTGSATSGTLYTQINNDKQEDTLFGANSHIAGLIRQFKAINPFTRVDAIALEDEGAAVKATGTVAFTDTYSQDGTITVTVGSRENHQYEIAVVSTDTPTTLGDKLETAINADTEANFTATNTAGSVEIECNNGGTVGNSIGLEYSEDVATGFTVTLTAFASGATDPTLTNLFDPVANQRYQTIVYPQSWDVEELTDYLDPRWNADNEILDGVGIVTDTDTVANLKTTWYNAGAAAPNSQSLVVLANEKTDNADYKAGSLFEMNDIVSAEFAATRALRLTDDTNLSLYVVGITEPRDLFGGTHYASKPYHETPMYNLPICDADKGFTAIEIGELNDIGLSVIGNNKANNGVVLGKIVTTYLTDAAGNTDTTYKYLNAVDTFSNIAEYFFNNFKRDYAQWRITSGSAVAGYNIANENTIKTSFVEYYNQLAGQDYVLTQGGSDASKYFSDNLDLDLDIESGEVVASADIPLVGQLRKLDAVFYAVFNI